MTVEKKSFIDAIKARRTYYQITNESTISDDRIQELVTDVLLNAPSAYNSQSARLVILLKEDHEKLWDIAKEVRKAAVAADAFPAIEAKINALRAGYGTILFYEDIPTVQACQEKFKAFADKFIQFSEHSSAMHQYALWTALEAEGLGASLQHQNPFIDQRVAGEWGVPLDWDLKAQLVFGKPTGQPGEKTAKPVEERLKVFGK
ncbi:putative fatty acid repression mutant protein [Xylona heveae TC161]|uniref:Putative fatty acid repression mutant protein n=1 Tax=Xylona heveae (strain CBS 132557 / TC161) TaxID=1328760 RepID=A0A165G514_XYLHT|nr:putative fatty acid repression mutant protein [Xylona heveae TC161]KZF21746.1 putative fatty acid repression mutant protein [Xylona heveae TC161]